MEWSAPDGSIHSATFDDRLDAARAGQRLRALAVGIADERRHVLRRPDDDEQGVGEVLEAARDAEQLSLFQAISAVTLGAPQLLDPLPGDDEHEPGCEDDALERLPAHPPRVRRRRGRRSRVRPSGDATCASRTRSSRATSSA